MKNLLQKRAICAAGLFFAGLLSLNANAGTIDDGDSKSSSDTGVPKPHFRASMNIREGYDDNVFTTKTDKVKSAFTGFSLNGFADLGNERTLFTIGLGVGGSYYYSRPGRKYDYSDNLSINFSHKVNERLNISLNSYTTYQVEPQYDLAVPQNRRDGQYFYNTDVLTASYQWTRRFSTTTTYQLTGIFYEDSAAKLTNDYVQQTFGNQFRYLLLPTTTVVLEYRFGIVNYLYQNDRNTITNYVLAGFDHTFSPKLTTTVRVGGQIQDQNVGGSDSSPYAEWTVNYLYERYSSLHFYLNYGFQYSNLAVSQNNKALRLGLTLDHGFGPKLTGSLGVFYEHDDFSQAGNTPGTAFTQDVVDVNASLRYAVTPRFSLDLSYTRTDLISGNAALEYDRDTVSLGATYGF